MLCIVLCLCKDNDMFGSLGLVDKFQLVKEVGQMAQVLYML